tara:strand:- start:133 stop:1785 length:1653 start_codon:yes stop_codon:yes gene_type:complete
MKNLLFILFLSFSLSQDYSINFDGYNDYVSVDHIDSYNNLSEFTWSSWVRLKPNEFPTEQNMFIFNKDHTSDYNQSTFSIALMTNEEPRTLRYNCDIDGSGSNNSIIQTSLEPFEDFEWHLITATFKSNETIRFYIDGNLIEEEIAQDGLIQNTEKLLFGTHSSESLSFFNGQIYDFLFLNEALTIEEVNNLYGWGFLAHTSYENGANNVLAYYMIDNGNGDILYDSSDNQNHGTIYGAEWVVEGCTDELACNYNSDANIDNDSCDYSCHDNGDYSLYFDGDDDYVFVGDNEILDLISEEFTLIAQVKSNSEDSGYILSKRYYSAGPGYELRIANNTLIAEINPGGNAITLDCPFEDDGEFHTILATYKNSEFFNLYLDGELVDDFGVDATIGTNVDSFSMPSLVNDEPFIIGEFSSMDGRVLDGSIKHISVLKRSMDSIAVEDIFNNGFSSFESSENLISHYNFNTGLGNILYDNSGNQNHGTIYGAEWVQDPILGDLNDDGILNILDIIVVANIAVGIFPYDETADLTGDGQVNILDVIFLVNLVLNS